MASESNAAAASPARVPEGVRAQRNRKLIVAAAHEAFLRDGYDASMDAIAADAGVSKVTVYNHFASKEALFTAVVGEALDQALGATAASAQSGLTGTIEARDALVQTARALIGGVVTPPVIALRNLVTGELRRFPELGEAWRRSGPDRFSVLLARLFEDLSDRNQLAIGDVNVAILQFYALTLYPHLVYGSYGGALESELAEKLLHANVDLFLNHYRRTQQADG